MRKHILKIKLLELVIQPFLTSRFDYTNSVENFSLVFNSLHNLAPSYLSELLTNYNPRCALRSVDHLLLQIPKADYKSCRNVLVCCSTILEKTSTFGGTAPLLAFCKLQFKETDVCFLLAVVTLLVFYSVILVFIFWYFRRFMLVIFLLYFIISFFSESFCAAIWSPVMLLKFVYK